MSKSDDVWSETDELTLEQLLERKLQYSNKCHNEVAKFVDRLSTVYNDNLIDDLCTHAAEVIELLKPFAELRNTEKMVKAGRRL